MTWTDRYLAAVLRSIPEPKRVDVERELRSSITDAVDERVEAGEEASAAERAVLEDLGDPAQLAAGYTGRPTYLIGPELFPIYRRLLARVLLVAVPIAAVIIGGLELVGYGLVPRAIGVAFSGALGVAIQTAFWITAFFAILDWAGPVRQARAEVIAATGRWTVERLPKVATGRISIGETASEIAVVLIAIGVLVFAGTLTTTDSSGLQIPLLAPDFRAVWLPILVAILALRGIHHVRAYNLGRWTRPHAAYHGLVQLAFGVLVVTLALSGWIVTPEFGSVIGVPNLADGEGPVMRTLAIAVGLATAYEVVQIFLRARRADRLTPVVDTAPHSA